MKTAFQGLAVFVALMSVAVYMLLIGIPAISQWEKTNGYPYGRVCDPNFLNAYHSTCAPARH